MEYLINIFLVSPQKHLVGTNQKRHIDKMLLRRSNENSNTFWLRKTTTKKTNTLYKIIDAFDSLQKYLPLSFLFQIVYLKVSGSEMVRLLSVPVTTVNSVHVVEAQ